MRWKKDDEFIENITNKELREYELSNLKNQQKSLFVTMVSFLLIIISYLIMNSGHQAIGAFIGLSIGSIWQLNNIKNKILLLKLAAKFDRKTE